MSGLGVALAMEKKLGRWPTLHERSDFREINRLEKEAEATELAKEQAEQS